MGPSLLRHELSQDEGKGFGLSEKRLTRHPGGRKRAVKVLLTEEERATIVRRAEAARVSIPRLLVEAALSGNARTATERRAIVIEVLAVRRLVAALGNNVNQLAKVANSTGEIPDQLPAVLDAVQRVLDRLDATASELAPS
ncbi:mobilization protein MobC [Thermomonospora umbrina]|uniref:Mobilization protein MobC n=1 Tax=Thermomonospora umbrina TaxID=111806 RepID=A0A3D9SSN7_9ACTN|nr:mobilization protein MobC [Thermomonospora umbrina]